jgi:hypothetical protein
MPDDLPTRVPGSRGVQTNPATGPAEAAHIGTYGWAERVVQTVRNAGDGRRWLRHVSGVLSCLDVPGSTCGALE